MTDRLIGAEPADTGPPGRAAWSVPGMDCPTEEALVRERLGRDEHVRWVHVDLTGRAVVVTHEGDDELVDAAIGSLGLGARRLRGAEEEAALVAAPDRAPDATSRADERLRLRTALGLNLVGFVVELVVGLAIGSVAVLADGLDMGADVAVYVLALSAVGAGAARQRVAARTTGVLMAVLAVAGLAEVVRRVLTGAPAPDAGAMALVTVVAMVLNIVTMRVLAGARHAGEHTHSAWVMTSSDVQANLVVLVAAGLVAWTGLAVPDLVVGGLVFAVVGRGSWRILRSTSTNH